MTTSNVHNVPWTRQAVQFFQFLVLPPVLLIGLRQGWLISEEGAQMLWLAYAGFLAMVFAAWRFERKRLAHEAFEQSESAVKAS